MVIPKVYNGKQKTFWFVNYEGVRQNSIGSQIQGYVPTPQERLGNLSDIGTGPYDAANPNDPTFASVSHDLRPLRAELLSDLVTPTAAQMASQPWINPTGFLSGEFVAKQRHADSDAVPGSSHSKIYRVDAAAESRAVCTLFAGG